MNEHRSDRKRQELQMRRAEHEEAQRRDLIRQIESLKASDFPTEPQSHSLSAQIEEFQIKSGLKAKPEREGLNPWVKADLYRAGEAHLNAPRYAEGAWQDENGNWFEMGLFNQPVPAKRIIPTVEDFEAEERQDRQFKRAAESFWSKYKVLYPGDDAQAVHAALRQVQGALSTREMIDIASDENSAFVAAGRIHQLIEAQQSQVQAMQDDNHDEDDGRSDGLGSGVASTGHVHSTQQPQERSAKSYGPMGSAMIELQRKMGIRKW